MANCSHPSCLCSPSSEIDSNHLKGCEGNCRPGGKQWRRVYDSRHLQADCQESGSPPEPYARHSSTDYLYSPPRVQVQYFARRRHSRPPLSFVDAAVTGSSTVNHDEAFDAAVLDSTAGWIASSSDLVRLFEALASPSTAPAPLLAAPSVRAMLEHRSPATAARPPSAWYAFESRLSFVLRGLMLLSLSCTTTTTTFLRPLYWPTCVKNWRILLVQSFTARMRLLAASAFVIMEETLLEFSSIVLSTLSPCLLSQSCNRIL